MTLNLPILRDYQRAADEAVEAQFAAGVRRVLLESPTGAGKGAISTHKTGIYIQAGGRVLFLVNRRALVHDMGRRLEAAGIPYGVLMSTDTRNTDAPAIIASIDTFRRRQKSWPAANLVIVDEAHTAVSRKWQDVTNAYVSTGSNILSLTATPITSVGGGLRNIADVIVPGPSTQMLIEQGHLVKPVAFAPMRPDLKGVQTRQGDYVIEQLSAVMNDGKVHGNITEAWMQYAKGRPTVAFCVDVAHAEALAERFLALGVQAVAVSAESTPDKERERIWVQLATGGLDIVCSVMLISYGWDCPPVSCAIMARPTKSLGLYLQQGGRVLRPYPGKTDAIILDHGGCSARHGLLDEDRKWTLDGVDKADPVGKDSVEPKECPSCKALYKGGRCPNCGYTAKVIDLGDDGWSMAKIVKPKTPQSRYAEIMPGIHLSAARQAAGKFGLDIRKDPAFADIVLEAQRSGHRPGRIWHETEVLIEARNKYRMAVGDAAPLHRAAVALHKDARTGA